MKMIRRYAIEPIALRRWENFRYVMEKLGFAEGRVMVALPRKWIRELLDSINDVGDVERSRFIAKLQRYKEDRIIQSGSPYDPQMSWVDNVRLLETQGIVDAILVSQDSCRKMNACKYHTPDDIDEEFFSGNREIRCMGTAQNLSLAADVFLEVSSEVRFIDPYFRIATSSYLDTLIAFTKLATATGRCGIFSIFTRQEEMPKGGYKTINKLLDDNLAKIMPDGFKVIIFFIDTSTTKINFHARYLLAAKGGLRYDKGFGVRHTPEIVDISLLDQLVHAELFEVYRSNNEELGIVESLTWVAHSLT